MSCWISKIVFLLSAYSSWKRMMFLKEKKNFSGNWWFCIGWVKFILRDENKWSYKHLLLGTLHSHSSTEQKRHASKLLYIPSSLLISSSSRNEKILAFIRFRRKLGFLLSQKFYNRDRRMHFIGKKGPRGRWAEANFGLPFNEAEGFMSQPSIFLGTHTSKSNWPRTPWALMLGMFCMWNSSPFCKLDSLVPLDSMELGKKKWSLGSIATLFRLSLELAATLWRLQTDWDIEWHCKPCDFFLLCE